MSSIGLDFTGLYVAVGIALVAALVAMPAFWALAAGLPRARRALLAALAAQGVAGPVSLLAMADLGDEELPLFALAFGVALQALVLLVGAARRRDA